MYASFFGLNEKPFSITPDPRYLFLSERHAEALAHLVYGINEAGGFIQLTGEVGTGKTTVVRSLLTQAPKHAEIALILNPRMTPPEFLLAICEELGIAVEQKSEGSLKDLVDLLSFHLLKAHAEGKRIVLVVDEAQNLGPDVLEQVRLLTNLETETQKLLQIILIGQPELRELLGRVELRQLAQRITGRYHLDPLEREDSAAYVRHRLRGAGGARGKLKRGAIGVDDPMHCIAAAIERRHPDHASILILVHKRRIGIVKAGAVIAEGHAIRIEGLDEDTFGQGDGVAYAGRAGECRAGGEPSDDQDRLRVAIAKLR